MSFEDERIAILNKFHEVWQASSFSDVPFFTDNSRETHRPENYFTVYVQNTASQQMNPGKEGEPAFMRHWGDIQITIYVPDRSGESEARKALDAMKEGFQRTSFSHGSSGKIRCLVSRIRSLGSRNGKYAMALTTEFYRTAFE